MFIYAESLIELAVRIGVDDLYANPDDIRLLLSMDPSLNNGLTLTPTGGQPTFDKTLFDEFQTKISTLRRVGDENKVKPVFRNPIPAIPDIQEYIKTANLRFVHGFPREAQDIPCVAITLGDENEDQQYFGVVEGMPLGGGSKGQLQQRVGSDFRASYHLHILSTNYDETVVLHHLVKYGLLKYRAHLEGYGIREAKLSFMDVEPAPEYLQGGLFVYQRTCVLSCVKADSFVDLSPAYSQLSYQITDTSGTILDPGKQILPGQPENGPGQGFMGGG